MKKILHINQPWIKYNQDYAFPSSMMSQDNSFRNWIFSNAIQVYYCPERQKFHLSYYFLDDNPNPLKYISLLDHQVITMEFIKKSSLTILDFTRLMIDSGYYISIILNEFYIKSRSSYKKKQFEHGVMIYGYEDESKVVYSAGFDASMHFGFHTISYDMYMLAFANTKRNSHISCFKRNSNTFEMDVFLCKKLTCEFIHSQNSSLHVRMIQNPINNCFWGISAFMHIADTCDIRYIYMVYEYTLLMSERVSFFENTVLGEEFKELARKFYFLVMLAIKNEIKKIDNYYVIMEEKLFKLLEEEKELMQKFYLFLENMEI